MNIRQLTFGALLAASVFIAMPKAQAGYAQLAPPVGWSAGTGAGGVFQAAANSSSWSQGVARATGSLNVGSRYVAVPAAMRLASNAPQYLASRIGAGWALGGVAGPLGLGLTIGAALLLPEITQWISSSNRVRWNPDEKRWEKRIDSAPVDTWTPDRGDNAGKKYDSPQAACDAMFPGFSLVAVAAGNMTQCIHIASGNVLGEAVKQPNSGPGGGRYEPADYPTEVKPEIEKTPFPQPARMPEILPGPWPIELPSVNPSPAPDYAPQPLHVPTGDPVRVPNSNPQRWEQPIVTITPSPTPDSPWRVNLTPDKVVSQSPEPIRNPWTGPVPNNSPNAGGNPSIQPTIEPDPTREPEVAPTDSALPDLPKLYEPKYKEGLEGVWKEQKEKLQSSSLSNLVKQLMPNVGAGGACPAWNVQLDFAGWANYGTKNVAPPCEVWNWGRMIVLVSALLLARALIFGG